MKRGSEFAKRVKQLHQQMVRKFGKPEIPEPTDPIHQVIIGILSENTAEAKAAALFARISEQMVDLNELRVTPPMELADLIGTSVPQAREKAQRIIRVLNEIRARQDALDLSFLKQRGRREAREFLESLEGVGLYAAASVMIRSLGGHAIPVDFLTIYVLRKEEVVEGTAGPADVQGFLERNVAAADGPLFATLLNRHVVAEGARVAIHRLPEILNLTPPELPKPKRHVMEKPGLPAAAVEGIPDLDAVDLEEGALAEVDLELAADPEAPEEGRAPKKSRPDKKREEQRVPQSAGKKSDKAAKSKSQDPPARKRKG